MRSIIAIDCSGVARDDKIAMQLPSANHRKSIMSNTQSGIESGITLNLLTAVSNGSHWLASQASATMGWGSKEHRAEEAGVSNPDRIAVLGE
ncbi:unnamed protein product [Spirodela intermedia]|uniref:Uncharacterized protein n=2 Tax=Spirodela intermedia TaxID=51605 RepID=A0A7I8L395_SPIIN|nr:unnamed protein product [Spirodela intermedia]CAA6667689.1 unnamed protein product [Spirodela intermedia]CAA7404501.1 unnamed protein product [Spirodela intermedia]